MDSASSDPAGNFAIKLDPALSSALFSGRKRQTTLMLHSPPLGSIVQVVDGITFSGN
jgi:hypothetical protein